MIMAAIVIAAVDNNINIASKSIINEYLHGVFYVIK